MFVISISSDGVERALTVPRTLALPKSSWTVVRARLIEVAFQSSRYGNHAALLKGSARRSGAREASSRFPDLPTLFRQVPNNCAEASAAPFNNSSAFTNIFDSVDWNTPCPQ